MNSAPPAPSPSSFFSPPPSLPSSSPPTLKFEYPNSHPDSSDYPSASSFNGPYMGILLVVLLVSFFLMASFSVYVRRHAFSVRGGEAGLGGTRARGLDRAAIDGLPIVVYHCAKGEFKDDAAAHAHEWSRRPDCVVCLTDFQEAENVRLLPKCEHCFHPECIDMWLFSHTTCPLCRRSLLPPANNATGTDTCINVQETSYDTPPPPPPPPSSPLTPR